MLKLSISYANGWKAIGTLVYSWPQALEKARAADRIVRERLGALGLQLRRNLHRIFRRERVPWPGCAAQSRSAGSADAHRRARAGSQSRGPFHARVDPAGAQRSAGRDRLWRRPSPVREIVAYWPALIPREEIATRVEVVE